MASLQLAVVAPVEGQEESVLDFPPPSEVRNFITAIM